MTRSDRPASLRRSALLPWGREMRRGMRPQPSRGAKWRNRRSLELETCESRRLLAGLVMQELQYHPSPPTAAELAAGFVEPRQFAFVELANRSDTTVALEGYRLITTAVAARELGIEFDFGQSPRTHLDPGETVVVVADPAAFAFRYGREPAVIGSFAGDLSAAGTTLTLVQGPRMVQQVAYDVGWYPSTNGAGYSLEAVDPRTTDYRSWSTQFAWMASSQWGGTPGNVPNPQRTPGDANGDGRFDQTDLVQVLTRGKYGTQQPAGPRDGDWNGDGVFDSRDFVAALATTAFRAIAEIQGVPDRYQVEEDGALLVAAEQGVLANDLQVGVEGVAARLRVPPAHGRLEFHEDGSFRYLPHADFFGADTFQYEPVAGVRAGGGTRVELQVQPQDDPPVTAADFYVTRPGLPLDVVARLGVLANDGELDREPITAAVSVLPSHGSLEIRPDGSFLYLPETGFQGIDRFWYQAHDGSGTSAPVEVSVAVAEQQVLVTEVASSVGQSLRDYDDDSSDWIEITNFASEPIDIEGWYLTDDVDLPAKWRVPMSTLLAPGASRVIFASGKDRVMPTGELHTNFRLAGEGEYLALVGSDGRTLIWDSGARVPALPQDVTWGWAVASQTKTLVAGDSAARWFLPADRNFDTAWSTSEYDDSAWPTGEASIGYVTEVSPTIREGFTARYLQVGGGRVWWLESALAAESLFDETADPLDYFLVTDATQVVPVVNFGGIVSVSPSGDFPDALPYPDGSTSFAQNDFALRVTATVTIPEGDWSIGFGSSDGGLLRVEGVPFLSTTNESGSAERIVAGDDEILFDDLRTRGWTSGTLRVPAGGVRTRLELISFERRGADFLELAIAPGHLTNAPSTRAGWTLLKDGELGWRVETVEYPEVPAFAQMFRTDVGAELFAATDRAVVRIPFQVEQAAAVEELRLQLQYDDGFIAMLNGIEVARAGVSEDGLGGVVAERDRLDAEAAGGSDFDLSPFRGLLRDGDNLLTLYGVNEAADSSGWLLVPTLTATSYTSFYPTFQPPSPGQRNLPGAQGTLSPPEFSVVGGAFREPFALSLSTHDPRAHIRYTLDGSVPNDDSPLYVQPLTIAVSSEVRARVFRPDFLPSGTATQLFVRMAEDLLAFDSNLPVLVLDTLGEEVPGTATTTYAGSIAALFDRQADGRSRLTEAPVLISRVALKERGSSSSSYPQKPYRLEFREDGSDDDREVELLGMPPESDYVMIPGYELDRSINRNTIIYDLSNQAGDYAVRTRYVEVFLNSGRGEVSRADYVGLYPLMESIKVDANRLDLGNLSPQYATEPDVTGGYILKIDRPAPGDVGITVGPEGHRITFQLVDPEESELRASPAQEEYLANYLTDWLTALFAPDFRHPATGQHYSDWVDVPSLIDHYLLYEFWQATDALFFSGHWYKPQGGKLHAGPIWDFDRSIGSTDGRNLDPRGWDVIRSAPLMWPRLFDDPEFRQALIDRWAELQTNVLGLDNVMATFDRITMPIAEAAQRNFARWTAAGPRGGGGLFGVLDGTWEGEVEHMRRAVQMRHHWLNSRFLAAPQLLAVPATNGQDGTVVVLAGDLNQDLLVDATDMALLSSAIRTPTNDPFADLNQDGEFNLLDLTRLARILDTRPGDANLDGQVDESDRSILLASQANPAQAGSFAWADGDFDGDGRVDDADEAILAVNFGFERRESIPTGRTLYYTTDGTDPRLADGRIAPNARQFTGRFAVAGTAVVQARMFDPDYFILEAGFTQSPDQPESWSGLTTLAISPEPAAITESLRITAVQYHPVAATPDELVKMPDVDESDFEFLRLTNLSTGWVSLQDVSVSLAVAFQFDPGERARLEPGSSVFLVGNPDAFALRYGAQLPVAGSFTGQLSNRSETVRLAVMDTVIQEFTYADAWFAETDGAGSFLELRDEALRDPVLASTAAGWRAAHTLTDG